MAHSILIVEDDSDILIILRHIVQVLQPPCDIRLAVNGEHALERMAEYPAVVVITDYNMTPISGLELAEIIRDRWPETFIIMITAFETHQLRQDIARVVHGHVLVDRFFPKPFDFGKLLDAVKDGLKHEAAILNGKEVPPDAA